MHCAKCFFYETDVGDDVCNRCGRAYAPEGNVYLGLLLLVTGGVAWTLRNLLTGHADPFTRPLLDLGLWGTWPVSIVDCPAYGLVIGAWLAMLGVAPLLTGLLYGKRGGWLMVIAAALVGPSPMLAAVSALGVWISSGWTLRLQSKLVSALLGLAPVAVYWFVATAMTDFSKSPAAVNGLADLLPVAVTVKTLAPALRPMAYVPPAAAVVLGVIVILVFVGIGGADRWHIRWPAAVLTVFVAGPVLALLAFVGTDEIRYGLLQQPIPTVEPGDAAPPSEADRLQDFLTRHPSSPRAAEVRARLAEHIEQIENGQHSGQAPRHATEIWQELLKQSPTSSWAADARLHLGDDAARQGLFEPAERYYREILAQTANFPASTEDPLAHFSIYWDYFTIGAELRAKEEVQHLRDIRLETQMRLGLMLDKVRGSADPGRALALYFVAMAAKGTNQYRARLQAVAEADPRGPLADNVAYDMAMLETDNLKRVEALIQVIAAFPGTEGAMLAHLAAARSLITIAASDPGALLPARDHLLAVQADLQRRAAHDPRDPYVAALAEAVAEKLLYVKAKLPAPDKGR